MRKTEIGVMCLQAKVTRQQTSETVRGACDGFSLFAHRWKQPCSYLETIVSCV